MRRRVPFSSTTRKTSNYGRMIDGSLTCRVIAFRSFTWKPSTRSVIVSLTNQTILGLILEINGMSTAKEPMFLKLCPASLKVTTFKVVSLDRDGNFLSWTPTWLPQRDLYGRWFPCFRFSKRHWISSTAERKPTRGHREETMYFASLQGRFPHLRSGDSSKIECGINFKELNPMRGHKHHVVGIVPLYPMISLVEKYPYCWW